MRTRHPGRPEPSGSNTRLFLLILAGSLWAGAVVARLAYLGLVRHAAYQAMAVKQQQRAIEITPERGTITDRNGNELAVSLPVESCFAVPPEIAKPALAARLLAPILKMSARNVEARLRTDRSFVWVARRLPPEEVRQISALNLRGIYFQREVERFYPKRQLAAQVLGFVNIDGRGQAGIEYTLDKEISGSPGRIHVFADGLHHYYQRSEQSATPGAQVELTIDENIQYIVEKELSRAIGDTRAIAGSVLVMNPNDGELLAMANWPTFDPNLPGDASPVERQNRAISNIYEPGSTFKTVTLSAALDEGVVTSNEVFNCRMGSIYLNGRVIHDWHPFGLLTVGQILMHSSDVGAIEIALKVGDDNFYHYIQAFGFGSKTGIRLPWESAGLLRPPRLWSASAIGSLAMGQAVGVTTLQLIDAISAIANGGLLYHPRIVRQIDYDGREIEPQDPPPTRPISAQTAATMRHMMEGVVLEGTGRKAQVEGYTEGGKTGTAQKIDPETHHYLHGKYVESFVGFAPLNNPAVVILVVLDSPHGIGEAGEIVAPIFKRVMQQVLSYMNVPPDVPIASPIERAALDGRQTGAVRSGSKPSAPKAATASVKTARAASGAPPPGTLVMPSLVGKTVRAAAQQCLNLGLNPQISGNGLAVGQTPEAGTLVRTGALVRVRFALRPDLVAAKAGEVHAR